ncbi:Uncharacterised protein [Mycobacteroides abscessus subsp. abscessus]|uniref:hypothetical protein n=1 Tax=Mycobacteroides abscessus TaxID=36809 RepID=UPI00092A2C67|nr:hypothetical protein [Mycobacteroides abscessus]SIH24686.1 Uncharacterised protein [Mycobacteroides abscessus subsp. abscessus]
MSETRLVDHSEISYFLHVSDQQMATLQQEPGFPEPAAGSQRGDVYDFALIEQWAIAAGHRTTFRSYLESSIAYDEEADPEIDPDSTRQQFLALIEPYGFTLDNAIPGTFEEILRKAF